MSLHDYQSTVSAQITDDDAFDKIARVSEWWSKGATGNAKQIGDTFKVDWGTTWVAFEIVEAVQNRKIVWQVVDCELPWLTDTKEWRDTKIVWDLKTTNGSTQVTMTHVGLNPAVECFNACETGWNFYFGKSLLKLFTDESGLPDGRGAAEA